jgi:hypothetical protein
MLTSDILNSHPVSTLKKEISKTNIKGYSKMKKNEIIELMLKNKLRFNHIVKKGEPPKPKKIIKIIKDKKPKIQIKITEAEEEKGGGAADPIAKQFKIPKPTAKIRIVPKKPKAQLGKSGIGNKRKREQQKPRKKKIIDVYVKPNEDKGKAKAKPKIPTITITEAEKPKRKVIKIGGRFITPKEVKSKLPPIPKFSGKFILPKAEKGKGKAKAKAPEDFKFEEKYLRIETFKAGSLEKYEIEYDNETENSYIEMTLTKRAKTILMIDTLSSQYDKDRPRARKGYTRAMLCHVINMLLNKNMIELKDKVELIAGNIGGIKGGESHNLINLVKMYENMGFKEYAQTKNQRNLESTVEKVLNWCSDKYNIGQKSNPEPESKPKPKPKAKPKAKPKEKAKGKAKAKAKPESESEEDEPKINVKKLSVQSMIKSLKQQIKEFKEEGKPTKRLEKQLKEKERQLSRMK